MAKFKKKVYKPASIQTDLKRTIKRLWKIHKIPTFTNKILKYFYYKATRPKTFKFKRKKYKYYFQWKNMTWMGERVIELPIIWNLLKKYKNKQILEVGNVLSQYGPVKHEILDKYEKAPGVINKDIMDYKPKNKYDLIISISTMEHVGYDEPVKDPEKVINAMKKLKNMLKKDGKLVITIPINYNPKLDEYIKNKTIQFNEKYWLKRNTKNNQWTETNEQEGLNTKYHNKYPYANSLFIGVIKK